MIRADERKRAREKLLDLRVTRHAIVSSLSKEGFAGMKMFVNELLQPLQRKDEPRPAATLSSSRSDNQRSASDISDAELRANRRAAFHSAVSWGATPG